MADIEKPVKELWKSVTLSSGTFIITKPKRKSAKLRQSRLKGTVRGARK
jgi:hypothetical protein